MVSKTSPAATGVPAIELRGATKRFASPTGASFTALRDLNLIVEPGEFCAIVGPTGCGKSTTLALISGLVPPSRGEVLVFGERVAGVGRSVGYMFQRDAVFPWKNVLDNVAAGPRFRGVSSVAIEPICRLRGRIRPLRRSRSELLVRAAGQPTPGLIERGAAVL